MPTSVGPESRRAVDFERMRTEYKRRYISPHHIAAVYFGLGELQETFAWLDKAYDDRDLDIMTIKIEPVR